jgi:hypothetical protein
MAGLSYRSPGYSTAQSEGGSSTTTTDKARNRPTLASGTYPTSALARNAVDGNPTTRWSSPYAINHWWQVDLGALRKVDQVRVTWEAAYASHYRISGSQDGTSFSPLAEVRITRPGVAATTFPVTDVRFIRIRTLERGTRWGASFFDVNVLGPAD